jgi:hypothetical protein
MEGTSRETPATAARGRFRLDRSEIAGAFGDLGTLIPFLAAYLAVVKLDPCAVLAAFGIAYIAVGAIFRTPFPVQPMKAIGAGGMAGHVQFGARTGAAPIVIGVLLLAGGVLYADAVTIFFAAFPLPVLGVILFLAGAQLALGICALGNEKADRFVALTTAAFAVWHVGVAFVFGLAVQVALRRGWVRL